MYDFGILRVCELEARRISLFISLFHFVFFIFHFFFLLFLIHCITHMYEKMADEEAVYQYLF